MPNPKQTIYAKRCVSVTKADTLTIGLQNIEKKNRKELPRNPTAERLLMMRIQNNYNKQLVLGQNEKH